MHDVVRAMAFMQFGSGYNVVVISAAVLVWDSEGELFTWTTDVLDGSVFLGLVVGTLALGNYADVTGRLAAQRLSCWLPRRRRRLHRSGHPRRHASPPKRGG